MDQVQNPYSPGPGHRPLALCGRAAEMMDMDIALQRLLLGRSAQTQLLVGLRGVGKTALLHEFARAAGRRGFVHEHIIVTEEGKIALRLAMAMRKSLLKLSGKKKVKGATRRALGLLKGFTLTLPDGPSLPIDVDEISGADSGDLDSDLARIFAEVGRAAQMHDAGVFLTIDELHRLSPGMLSSVLFAWHGAVTARLPVTMAGAGLPSLAAARREAGWSGEQLFRFRALGPLSPDDVAAAVREPAAAEGVGWKGTAVARLCEVTQGYPSFVQELAHQAWDVAQEGSRAIRLSDVERSIPLAQAELDQGFFQLRSARATEPERSYLRAMAELGSGVVKSADVAALLQKKTTQVAPVRDSLMKKAFCFSPRYNELAFTAPLFDQFHEAVDAAFPMTAIVRRAFIGLGSNLGDRSASLRQGVAGLKAGGDVIAVSPLYETEPVGGPRDQGPFLNVVVELATTDSPRQLLTRCQALEVAAHRVRTVRFGPRTLDADVLLVGDLRIDEPDLVVPHPRMWERRFVLQPLTDLAPELVPTEGLIASGGQVTLVGNL